MFALSQFDHFSKNLFCHCGDFAYLRPLNYKLNAFITVDNFPEQTVDRILNFFQEMLFTSVFVSYFCNENCRALSCNLHRCCCLWSCWNCKCNWARDFSYDVDTVNTWQWVFPSQIRAVRTSRCIQRWCKTTWPQSYNTANASVKWPT